MTDVSQDHRQTPSTGGPTLDDLAGGLTPSHRDLVLQVIRSVKAGRLTSRDLQGVTEAGGPDAVLAAVQELLAARPPQPLQSCPAWCVHPEACTVEIETRPWREFAHDGAPTTVATSELEVTISRRALHAADEPYKASMDTIGLVVVSRVWKDMEVDAFLSPAKAREIAAALTTEVGA